MAKNSSAKAKPGKFDYKLALAKKKAAAEQQLVLNVFKDAFSPVLSSPSFTTTLQSVKQALFDRDFARAFGDEEHLSVYAARYGPTRALCYLSVLSEIQDHLHDITSGPVNTRNQAPSSDTKQETVEKDENETQSLPPPIPTLRVLAIGGGAAETVAFAGFLNRQLLRTQQPSPSPLPRPLAGAITLLDSAAWGTVVSSLSASLLSAIPSLSPSTGTNDTNTATPLFSTTFTQQDALALDPSSLQPLLLGTASTPDTTSTPDTPGTFGTPVLITVLFTLNELFTSAGIGKTTKLLLDLTFAAPIGSLLLVIDSPGSYSETRVGKDAKRYPMQWLLDRIMLGTRAEPVAGRRWAKLESSDSVWFRLSDGLDYPIPLENMRYQMHLYRAEEAK